MTALTRDEALGRNDGVSWPFLSTQSTYLFLDDETSTDKDTRTDCECYPDTMMIPRLKLLDEPTQKRRAYGRYWVGNWVPEGECSDIAYGHR